MRQGCFIACDISAASEAARSAPNGMTREEARCITEGMVPSMRSRHRTVQPQGVRGSRGPTSGGVGAGERSLRA